MDSMHDNPSSRGVKILIIEDNKDFAEILCSVLEMMGHEVMIESSGADGLACANQIQPDIIICDFGLPDMDGNDVAHAIRRNPDLHNTFMIGVSGFTAGYKSLELSDDGFNKFFIKPFEVGKLIETINEVAGAVPSH